MFKKLKKPSDGLKQNKLKKKSKWNHYFDETENEEEKETDKKELKNFLKKQKQNNNNDEFPDLFGFFNTNAGKVAVGHKKLKQNSQLAFTLVKDEKEVPDEETKGEDDYFGKNYDGRDEEFEVDESSFKYDPKTKEIEKINAEKSDEDELVYRDEKEEKTIKKLTEIKNLQPENRHLDEKIEENKVIKQAKKEENNEFLKEIKRFIEHYESGKLKLKEDSDETVARKERLERIPESIILLKRIKKILEEIAKNEACEKVLREEMKKQKLELDLQTMSVSKLKKLEEFLKNFLSQVS